ncbi:amidase [Ferrimicrobium sp.]|uniref:amidase n=1 Tax=Ferrimicrobium sp. TaxID=2926050 RepID=UPI00261AA6E2|nr:amidase [Ferrimicrobium sp.]
MSLTQEEYRRCDATELANLIADRQIQAQEAIGAAFQAAWDTNGSINALIELYRDRLESPIPPSLGVWGGVPYAIKDIAHIEPGRHLEYGSRLGVGLSATQASHLLTRLSSLGLVAVGRTASSELAIAGVTETKAFGPTRTPWDLTRSAGGSSGGSAAAVAAGIVPVALGSDGGGSIRIPASCCGVIGLKPTRGRISAAPWADSLAGFASTFLLTRSVRDTVTALTALSGTVPGDHYPLEPFQAQSGDLPRLRIRLMTESPAGKNVDPQIVGATQKVARQLESLGHFVDEGHLSIDWEEFVVAMGTMWAANVGQMATGIAQRSGRAIDTEALERQTLTIVQEGIATKAQALLDAGQVFNRVNRSLGSFFGDFDILLTPTLGQLPPPIGRYDPEGELSAAEFFDSWSDVEGFLPLFNCSGQPAVSLPLGFSTDGLPIGIQVVGRYGDDATVLALAYQLERAIGIRIAPPTTGHDATSDWGKLNDR